MQQFQNATTMQEKADLQQEYMAELNAYINFMSDPGLISSYVSSDEGSKLRRGLNQVMDLRVRDLNNALARKGSFTSGIYDPSAPNVAGTAGGGIQSTLGQPFEMPDFMQRQQVGQGGIETVWDYIPMGFGAGPAGEGTLNTEGVPTLEALRSKFETETNEPGKWSQQMMLDFNRFANTPAGKEMIDQFIPKKNYGGWRLNDLFDAAESAGLLDIGGWRWTKSDTGRPAGT